MCVHFGYHTSSCYLRSHSVHLTNAQEIMIIIIIIINFLCVIMIIIVLGWPILLFVLSMCGD